MDRSMGVCPYSGFFEKIAKASISNDSEFLQYVRNNIYSLIVNMNVLLNYFFLGGYGR